MKFTFLLITSLLTTAVTWAQNNIETTAIEKIKNEGT